jgi:hypothetical protein
LGIFFLALSQIDLDTLKLLYKNVDSTYRLQTPSISRISKKRHPLILSIFTTPSTLDEVIILFYKAIPPRV